MTHLWVSEHAPEGGGTAPVVVLVHGSMDRSASFARVQRHLGDLHVVRYDRRGYGRSRHVPVATSFDDHVDDLLEVLGGRRAAVVGHSLGGVVALAAAQRAPDVVRAVGAYESPTPWVEWWPRRSAGNDAMKYGDPPVAAETFMRRLIGDDKWDALPERTRRERREEGPALVAELVALQSPVFDPAEITVPVVAGRGSASKPHHRRTAAELAAAVPGAELIDLEGCQHGAHASHPDRFAAFVRRVVTRAGER